MFSADLQADFSWKVMKNSSKKIMQNTALVRLWFDCNTFFAQDYKAKNIIKSVSTFLSDDIALMVLKELY